MIDNFALVVFHTALLILMLRLLRTPDPDAGERPRRRDPRRPRPLPGAPDGAAGG
jgi:hypothetical protein